MSDSASREPPAGQPRPHRLVVDRLEGEVVVVEIDGGALLDFPRWMLPPAVAEGDVLHADAAAGPNGEWRVEIRTDAAETEAARREAEERLQRLRQRDPGGDVRL